MPTGEVKWVKFGNIKNIAILGKEIIAIASGLHVLFINLNTKDERVERFDSKERGEGASCIAGHPVVPMFAISERRTKPTISIYTYPTIERISTCIYKSVEKKVRSRFLFSVFGGTDYLLTLMSYPDFKLIVWSWRTGENLKVIDTEIKDNMQQIICSVSSPLLIVQLGKNSGKMIVYDMNVCSKIIVLSAVVNYSTEKVTSTAWTYDGNLLFCDELGNVFLMQSDGKRRHLVVKSNITEKPHWKPLIADFRGGVAVVNSDCRILFYRKLSGERIKHGSFWKFIWEVKTISQPIYMIRHPQRNSLLFCTITGEIIEISVGDDDVPRMQMICNQGCGYSFLMPINPRGLHIAVLDGFNRLLIIESQTGNLSSVLCQEEYGKVLYSVAHPALPIMAMCTETGRCNIVNVIDAMKPVLIKSLFLIKEPLDKMKFSWDEKMLAITNKNGYLFIIDGINKINIEVKTFIRFSYEVVDFLLYQNNSQNIKIYTLIKSHPSFFIGKYIIVYNLKSCKDNTPTIQGIIELPNILKSIHYSQRTSDILASPYLTKQLQIINITENMESTSLTDCISSSHRLRDVNINCNSQSLLTFGYDGLVIMRNRSNINQIFVKIATHHRQEGGVKNAILCTQHNIIISLGKNGNLVASQITLLINALDMNGEDTDAIQSLQTPSILIEYLNEAMNESWIEWNKAMELQQERETMITARNAIQLDLINLKVKLKKLIDENELASENSRLPIDEFDLDAKARAEKIELNCMEKVRMKINFENQILCQDRVSEYLKTMYWDLISVPACALISLDGNTRVDNYPMPMAFEEKRDSQSWGKFSVKSLSRTAGTEENCIDLQASTVKIEIRCENKYEEDEEEKLALSGTTSYRWVQEDTSNIVNQISRDGCYTQGVKMNFFSRIREEKLKSYFNNLFENMRAAKEDEIKLAKAQIARINHCSSELKEMFQLDYSVDFNWLHLELHDSEKPQTVVEVKDEEVYKSIGDFIDTTRSDEMNNSIHFNEITPEDLFREEALQQMMGGVLEVRWEDEIKKDVVKPQCLSKDPENYTDDDLITIKTYEEAVEILKVKKLKYKSVLENEIINVQKTLRENVYELNRDIEMFFLKRIKIESAVLQESLMRLQESRRHQLRLQGMAEVARLENNELASALHEARKLTEDLPILESMVNDTKNRYENLCKREKLLEGKLRGEFPDLKQPMVDYLLRHYKKRPRIGQLMCTSIIYLTEVSKCILSGDKSVILPRDCLDFLKGMNSLDVMPSGLPNQIDSNHWFLLCKLRRSKVEIETRLKCAAVELAEAEQTFGNHQKVIQNAHNKIQQLKESIEIMKQKNTETLHDMEIQLVLKMGQIETNLCGHSSDFKNSILVAFDQVFQVNSAIVEAGRKKLVAMNQTIIFRRTIQWKEWCHNCLNMTLNDMNDELKVLQDVKVTKEIQKYLMRNLHIVGSEKDMKAWERSIMSTKKRFRRMLEDEKELLIDVTKRLNKWQKKNNNLNDVIEKTKLVSFKVSVQANDEERARDERYRRTKLKAIMKRNRLITKVQNNYEDLLALRSQLELLRLKTYPTLRLKDSNKEKRRRKIYV